METGGSLWPNQPIPYGEFQAREDPIRKEKTMSEELLRLNLGLHKHMGTCTPLHSTYIHVHTHTDKDV